MCTDYQESPAASTKQEMTDGSSVVTDLYRDGRQVENTYDPDGRLVSQAFFDASGTRQKDLAFYPETGALWSENIVHPDGSTIGKYYTEDGALIPDEEL
ncbi:MAG: hypothetical protein F4X82_01405 [Candidatus Spechtbacteria bacterium SB0662_bin_43]|uniref:Toxin-antitoxin system YwqK family antitoxin n=1 Tax=Candidatus Spechtbacteria bacterium SB0662_bin_43 TaxID=2604897 RepID=A0A845D9J2_9BACT|nr:hypothetical protein [Candidatus Spechtbacteria bacterium SB0662_bin_43]